VTAAEVAVTSGSILSAPDRLIVGVSPLATREQRNVVRRHRRAEDLAGARSDVVVRRRSDEHVEGEVCRVRSPPSGHEDSGHIDNTPLAIGRRHRLEQRVRDASRLVREALRAA
jgi:hypothetical protein